MLVDLLLKAPKWCFNKQDKNTEVDTDHLTVKTYQPGNNDITTIEMKPPHLQGKLPFIRKFCYI